MKKKRSILKNLIIRIIAHIIYFAGLSVLIPLIALLAMPSGFLYITKPLLQVTLVAVIFVFISIVMLYYSSKSIGKVFINLGIVTLFSAGLGIIFSIYGKDVVFQILQKYIIAFERIQPILDAYLHHSVPKIRILTIGYLVLGIVFLVIGLSFRRKEGILKIIKKTYGPRARIFK